MKVLIISHAYAEEDNRKKIEELSKIPGLKVGVIYPRVWRTWHGELKDQRSPPPRRGPAQAGKLKTQSLYEEFPLPTFFSGDAGRYFYSPLELFSAVRRFGPDLIHLEEEPFTPVALEATFLSRFLRRKMVFFTWENIDLPLGFWRSWIEKFVFKSALAAVAGNSEAKERLKRRGFSRRINIIPQFGVDTEIFRPSSGEDDPLKGSCEGRFTVGFVGRPSLAKGIDLLFEAAAKADRKTKLLVVTSSPSVPPEVINLATAAGLSERVEFQTSIPHARLPEYLRRMDVFVLPSRATPTWQEQFGRTLVEAMACGVPVIGSSSGAIPEVVAEAGLIFREGDSGDLARCLTELSSDRLLWQKLNDLGFKAVQENYSFRRIAARTVEFYFSL